MKIIYMGTPDFAIYPLKNLLTNGHQVAAVFSKEDKPQGRGQKTILSPVKDFALKQNIPVYTPKTLRDVAMQALLASFAADVIVVFAYGLILPPEVLYIPKYGCINIHPSLLPLWRGASPVASAILNGDSITGVSVMHMDNGIDSGALFGQATVEILENDTTATLTDKLAKLSGDLLCSVLDGLQQEQICPWPQDESLVTMSKKFDKESGLLDFSRNAYELKRKVMAFNPWPSAYTRFNGKILKINTASYNDDLSGYDVGTVMSCGKGFAIVCKQGLLVPSQVQLEGKKAMTAHEFLNGAADFIGSVLI